jgi:CubicO group peptidase (beta-lactamase class C family)
MRNTFMRRKKVALAATLSVLAAAPLAAQQAASAAQHAPPAAQHAYADTPAGQRTADVEDRIRRIENGLLTPVVINGRDDRMTLGQRMVHYNVPGLSIAVINDGRIEWAKGYGVAQAGGDVAIDTLTLFQAASISKPVGAMGALRLVEGGRLALDADVNASLASWRVEDNGHTAVERVTLRRLLSHNAGLTVHGFRGYARDEAVPTLVQLLDGTQPANSRPVRPDTTPGAIWRYSGGGSSIAQLLMQDVTGQDFPTLMRELVLRPAGMVHSGYEQPLPDARAPFAAVGHRMAGAVVAGQWHTYPEMFAAGLWTTPSDLARLAIHVQRSFGGAEGGILSPAMTRQMLSRQAGEYGLGFAVQQGDGWTAFSHGGANEGFRANFYAFADRGQGAIIMTNGDNGGPLMAEMMRAVAVEYGWPTQRPVVRDVAPIAAARVASLAGTYSTRVNDNVMTVRFTADGATLHSVGAPVGTRVLHHAGEDGFFPLDANMTVAFERDAAGRGVAAVLAAAGGQRIRLERED